jgi:hypothetical protein
VIRPIKRPCGSALGVRDVTERVLCSCLAELVS